LLAYGYSVEENPYDEYLLKLKIPNKSFFREYFRSEGMISTDKENAEPFLSKLFAISKEGMNGVPTDLLYLLELLDSFQTNPNQSSPPQTIIKPWKDGLGAFTSNSLEKYELIMPFLLNQLSVMKKTAPKYVKENNFFYFFLKIVFSERKFFFFIRICSIFQLYGIELEFIFPGEEDVEEGDEPELVVEGFEGKVTFSYDPKKVDLQGKFLVYYLIGQYQILVNLIQEIDLLFRDMEEANMDSGDDDDDDEEEEDED
jgi:hypothetical protein